MLIDLEGFGVVRATAAKPIGSRLRLDRHVGHRGEAGKSRGGGGGLFEDPQTVKPEMLLPWIPRLGLEVDESRLADSGKTQNTDKTETKNTAGSPRQGASCVAPDKMRHCSLPSRTRRDLSADGRDTDHDRTLSTHERREVDCVLGSHNEPSTTLTHR